MPIYEFRCNECNLSVEKIQAIGAEAPTCSQCGGAMSYHFSPIAMFKLKNEGGYPIRSKSYKKGYQKEYLKDKGQEVWRDEIITSSIAK